MSKSELIVGLDVGTTKICAVVGEPSENGGMDIVGIGTSPVHRAAEGCRGQYRADGAIHQAGA